MSDSSENTPGKPLVGAIRESPVSAPRALSFQVVRVTTDICDSSENTRPTTPPSFPLSRKSPPPPARFADLWDNRDNINGINEAE